MQLGVDSDHIFQQNNYPFTEDPMFPFPERPPYNFDWSNAKCLLRIREDQLMVIDGGYQTYGTNESRAISLKSVSSMDLQIDI